MRISSLKYFYEVSELKSISKVSNNLHISQPALSHQLSKLEKELGVKLFDRSNKGVELTNKGKILYDYAKQILTLHDNLIEDINEDDCKNKEIRINVLNTHANFILDGVVRDMGSIFKNINISINSQKEVNKKALLIHNRADLVISCSNIDDADLISEYIGSDKLILVSGGCLECNSIERLPVALLDDDSNTVLKTLENMSKVNVCLKTDSLDVIKSYLKKQNVAAVVPRISVEKELKSGELMRVCSKGYDVSYDLFVTYRKDIDANLKKKFKIFKKELESILNKECIDVVV